MIDELIVLTQIVSSCNVKEAHGRQELLEARDKTVKRAPLCTQSRQEIFQPSPLNLLKTHFRTIPAVKMPKIFDYEEPPPPIFVREALFG